MKKRITFSVLALFAACLVATTGCGESKTNIDTESKESDSMKSELTQRQIELLAELELPTDYEDLNSKQKNAIVAIEQLLTYLEEKYDRSFSYLGYVAPGILENEHLLAYPTDGDVADVVTLYRVYENGEYKYKDDYANILARPLYEEVAKEFVSKYVEPEGTKVFCEILNVKDDVKQDNVIKVTSAMVYVFIDAAFCTKEQYSHLSEACKQWLGDNYNGMPGSISLYMTNTSEFSKINQGNYIDKLREKNFMDNIEWAINADGIINAY